MFSRIAVVNRGEPAVRLIRAVRELDAVRAPGAAPSPPIRVIALHTEAERRATFWARGACYRCSSCSGPRR